MKKERSVLKTYFATNKIPTADNFGEFIDSGLNQVEDGIKKDAGNPVSIQAEGQGDGVQDVLYFYKNFNDSNPAWRINQNPRTNPLDPATGKQGLNFSGATGISRLFIKSDDGNVGIGTITPGFPLTFPNQLGDKIAMWGQSGNSYGFGIQQNLLQIHTDVTGSDVAFGSGSSSAMNETMRIKGNGNVGIGTSSPKALLDVGGFIPNNKLGSVLGRLEEGNNNGDGTFLGIRGYGTQFNVFNGKSFGIEHSFYGNVNTSINFFRGNSSTGGFLTFNTNNNTEKVRITADGNVGIGNLNPSCRLEVTGGGNVAKDFKVNGRMQTGDSNGNGGIWLNGPTEDAFIGATGDIVGFWTNKQGWNALTIKKETGWVGIGTSSPRAKLEVAGAASINYGSYGYLSRSGAGVQLPVNSIPISIMTSDRIISTEFDAISDARIKKDFSRSNSRKDIETLSRLEIKDYRYKDQFAHGTAPKKGFVAQEVEKVFPEAVLFHSDFIPDTFSKPEIVVVSEEVLIVTMKEEHGFNTNDVVRLITSAGCKDVIVTKIDNNGFSVTAWKDDNCDVFVYGKKVDDFRTVDYNSIFTLGISAIQELYKQLQQLREEFSHVREKLSRTLIPV